MQHLRQTQNLVQDTNRLRSRLRSFSSSAASCTSLARNSSPATSEPGHLGLTVDVARYLVKMNQAPHDVFVASIITFHSSKGYRSLSIVRLLGKRRLCPRAEKCTSGSTTVLSCGRSSIAQRWRQASRPEHNHRFAAPQRRCCHHPPVTRKPRASGSSSTCRFRNACEPELSSIRSIGSAESCNHAGEAHVASSSGPAKLAAPIHTQHSYVYVLVPCAAPGNLIQR